MLTNATHACRSPRDAGLLNTPVFKARVGGAQVVIFVKSVARARELSKLLIDCNFPAICIHSAMGQEERCALCHVLPKP